MEQPKPLTLKETWSIFLRGWKIIYQRMPRTLVSVMAYKGWESLAPYIGVFFAARVIEELAGGRDPTALRNWVLLTLLAGALAALVTAALTRWKEIENCDRYMRFHMLNGEKYQSLDYVDAESTKVRDMYHTIFMNQMGPGLGLYAIMYTAERTVGALCGIIGGLALTVGLFAARVPESGGSLTVLNHPLCLVGMIAVVVLIPVLSGMLRNSANTRMMRNPDDFNLANALFSFFSGIGLKIEKAPDLRVYRQERFSTGYMYDKHQTFASKGMFARRCRGEVGLLHALARAVTAAYAGVAYVYVCLKSLGGAFGVGMVTQYVAAITQLSSNIAVLFTELGFLRMNANYIKLNLEFLDLPNNMYMGSITTEKRSDRQYDIEFRDVGFRYPGSNTWALRHVNMKFRVGGHLSVVGQNGSGKTTFIKLLCRLYDPTEGAIFLNDIDIRKYNYDQYLDLFSVVFQDFGLLAYPLGENVAASVEYDKDRVRDCLEKAGFGERLDSLPQGLDTYINKAFDNSGVTLSGGEAQKVAIARSLYKDAPFIVLDEPTAALDPIAEEEIYSKFSQIVTDKTAIYISHRLSSCRFCDEILVFDGGTVVQQGNHESLLAEVPGKYNELWYAQAQYYNEEERRRLL